MLVVQKSIEKKIRKFRLLIETGRSAMRVTWGSLRSIQSLIIVLENEYQPNSNHAVRYILIQFF